MSTLIRDWGDLKGLESNTHRIVLESSGYSGWIIEKKNPENMRYLSTHTFYGGSYQSSTVMLRECGFDVTLRNWDGETEEIANEHDQWIWNGNCEYCRRKQYCNKPCKMKQGQL